MNSQPTFARGFALLVAVCSFMELLDGTIIQTALKNIGASLGIDAGSAAVAMSAYFAAVAATIPLSAWLSDRVGTRASFIGGIALFVLASVFCGTATSLWSLLAFRVLQGIGGAVMITVGQLSVLKNAPQAILLRVTAYLVWPALAAPVLAPPIGGLITDFFGWRWLFFINIPLGLVCALVAIKLAPIRDPTNQHKIRLDGVGAALLAAGLFILIPALSLVDLAGSPWRLATIVVGAALCVAALIWLLRTSNPLLNLRLYSIATFRVGNGSGALYRAVVASVPVIFTLMFQQSFGWSASLAGLSMMWLFVGNIGAKPMANFVVRRFGFRAVVLWATAIGAATVFTSAWLNSGLNFWLIGGLLVVSGAARSIGFTAYASLQFADVPKTQMGSAAPLSASVAQLATAFGIASFVGLLAALGSSTLLANYRVTLVAMSALLLLSVVGVLRLHKNAGAQITS